jgi:metal-sensitive transcriptional repressor
VHECGDVLRLIASARGALDSLMAGVIEGHIRDHSGSGGHHPVVLEVARPLCRSRTRRRVIVSGDAVNLNAGNKNRVFSTDRQVRRIRTVNDLRVADI